MVKEAITHRHNRQFCYCVGDGHFIVKIITKKDDLSGINYMYMDKYPNPGHNELVSLPMVKVASDSLFDYYEIKYKNTYIATRYCFELHDKDTDEVLYYSNYKFLPAPPTLGDDYFNMPKRMLEVDSLNLLTWMNEGIVYQIFPDRFNRGSKVCDKDLPDWDKKPHWHDKFGGTLNGVTEKLDYLHDLGVDILYFTPIFSSPSPHKYDTADYMQIDPEFGTEEDFKALVDGCHKRGMKIILDCVFDHSGKLFAPFVDLFEKKENSKYKDWFHINDISLDKTPPVTTYDCFSYYGNMPKLNVDNDEVRDYVKKVIHHWMDNYDIDGWRLDVADEVAHTFWTFFNREVKSIKPDAAIIGEVWYDATDWLTGKEFDTTMNYPFTNAVHGFISKKEITPTQFVEEFGFIRGTTNYNAYNMLWNLLDSHDSARFLHCVKENKNKFKLAIILQMTTSGTPMIYYGDEVGMTGGPDPDCRRGMIWDEDKQDKELFNFYKNIIKLRKSHPCLYKGDMHVEFIDDEKNILVFSKNYNDGISDETIYVLINNSNKKFYYEELKNNTELLTNTTSDGYVSAYGGALWKKKENTTES